jgi:outer membrane protein
MARQHWSKPYAVSGGAVQSRVREALANQERVLQNLNNARRNSAMQVSQHSILTSTAVSLR